MMPSIAASKIISEISNSRGMAKSKTGSFWLTERISMDTDAQVVQGELSLGSYVDVGDQQAIAIEFVDYVWQRQTALGSFSGEVEQVVSGGPGAADCQLSDLNPATAILAADDNSLISGGNLHIDGQNYVVTHATDFYPDSFGTLSEARMIVNDTLFICGLLNGTIAGDESLSVTVRIKCRIVKLSTKDWMAIAIQSTASDN